MEKEIHLLNEKIEKFKKMENEIRDKVTKLERDRIKKVNSDKTFKEILNLQLKIKGFTEYSFYNTNTWKEITKGMGDKAVDVCDISSEEKLRVSNTGIGTISRYNCRINTDFSVELAEQVVKNKNLIEPHIRKTYLDNFKKLCSDLEKIDFTKLKNNNIYSFEVPLKINVSFYKIGYRSIEKETIDIVSLKVNGLKQYNDSVLRIYTYGSELDEELFPLLPYGKEILKAQEKMLKLLTDYNKEMIKLKKVLDENNQTNELLKNL